MGITCTDISVDCRIGWAQQRGDCRMRWEPLVMGNSGMSFIIIKYIWWLHWSLFLSHLLSVINMDIKGYISISFLLPSSTWWEIMFLRSRKKWNKKGSKSQRLELAANWLISWIFICKTISLQNQWRSKSQMCHYLLCMAGWRTGENTNIFWSNRREKNLVVLFLVSHQRAV